MRILVALVLVCAGTIALWASLDRPLNAPDWTGDIRGLAYSPSHLFTERQKDESVTDDLIRKDFEHLSKFTKRVRTYTVDYNHDRIAYIAGEFGMKVSLGIWLRGDKDYNELEIARALKAIQDNPGIVDRVFVGNEVVGVRAELTGAEVSQYIKRVKSALTDPAIEVGTAEVWPTWLDHPELADGADFVGIHILPYWDGVAYDKVIDHVVTSYDTIAKLYPGKKIVIGETGWPSDGRVKKGAVPSQAYEAAFLRQFFNLAAARNYDYYIMEAYDQPWKGAAGQEGAVGAFWGMFDAERAPKFDLTGPLSSFADWSTFAAIATGATLVIGLLVLIAVPAMSTPGYLLLAGTSALISSGALFIVDATSLRYIDWGTLGAAVFVVPAGTFTAALLLSEIAEWSLSLWRRNRALPLAAGMPEQPRVSIHVPTHNEPPLMVMQTLNALSRLDYQNFEVIVLDNNTDDDSLWRPVAAHCETLGPRFRFFHLDGVKGFKAGALNKALELTDPAAQYVAVIDSDYQVAPEWLTTVMPGFGDPAVAVVQAPQDYRDSWESLFKSFLYEEYTAFFRIGMVERNEHNAIIQHGTMCVVRRSALEEVGGWAEWCITEDTELGLRLFEAGYKALYTPVSMGRGLMPDTYDAYKGQRYRWVYGAMQILKRHAREIFAGVARDGKGRTKLSAAQRYHFVAGWLPWFADAFALVFGVFALVWTALMTIAPKHFDVPLTALSGVALALFTIKTLKTVWLHRAKVGTGFGGALASALTGLSLSFTVGKGVIAGLFTSSKPFLRTPKCADTAQWTRALRIAASETALLVATILAIAGTVWATQIDDPAELVWVAALSVMAVPYAAALLVAIGSAMQLGTRPARRPDLTPPKAVPQPDVDMAA